MFKLLSNTEETDPDIFQSNIQEERLPKFLIIGGMKCGTTSLHSILSHHPQVFLPEEESHFFSMDDIEQNPDFFLRTQSGWPLWDLENNLESYLPWYEDFFPAESQGRVIGEDCVSYLYSEKAAKRIAKLLPQVKIICMLRDPVARTYSHYWHLVKTNRAIYSFEDTLQFSPGTILDRSMYSKHVHRLLEHIPRGQVKFILLEEFSHKPQYTIDAVRRFLGLDENLDLERLEHHVNKALVPRSVSLQLFWNRLLKTKVSGRKYTSFHLPQADSANWSLLAVLNKRVFNKLNLSEKKKYPQMKPDTRRFLEHLFRKENRELSKLTGLPVRKYWPYL